MKRISLFILTLLVVSFLVSLMVNSMSKLSEKRRLAELAMLRTIKVGVEDNLVQGRKLPTNWATLSNSVKWDFVAAMSQDGFIPPATESYTILPQPYFFNNFSNTGFIFLVRSTPCKWAGLDFGRWALVASSNRVFQTWFPEDYLPPEIRSQLIKKP